VFFVCLMGQAGVRRDPPYRREAGCSPPRPGMLEPRAAVKSCSSSPRQSSADKVGYVAVHDLSVYPTLLLRLWQQAQPRCGGSIPHSCSTGIRDDGFSSTSVL
jgi:hypothetical protein